MPYGMHHADDIQYPFRPDLMPIIQTTDPEHFMIERVTRMWEHFAYTGSPNYDLAAFNWPKFNLTNEFYLDIDTHLVEKNGLFLERYSVWDRALASSSTILKLQNVFIVFFVTICLLMKCF